MNQQLLNKTAFYVSEMLIFQVSISAHITFYFKYICIIFTYSTEVNYSKCQTNLLPV